MRAKRHSSSSPPIWNCPVIRSTSLAVSLPQNGGRSACAQSWPTFGNSKSRASTCAREFALATYGAKFDFVSGGPGYVGEVFVILSDLLGNIPAVLARNNHGALRAVSYEYIPPELGPQ